MNRIVASLVCTTLWLALGGFAQAAGLTVTPVQLFFADGAKSQNLTVVNAGGDKVSVQVVVKKWSISPDGRDRYVDSTDLVFFPRIFELEPDEEAVLRIGRKDGSSLDEEKAYRIYLSELPVGGMNTPGVSMVMTLSVPIFLQTKNPELEGVIAKATLDGGKLNILMENRGSTFFVVRDVEAVGLDGEGAEVFRKNRSGWYVLAGAKRAFPLKLDPEDCRKASRLDVTMAYGQTTRTATVEFESDDCSPESSAEKQ